MVNGPGVLDLPLRDVESCVMQAAINWVDLKDVAQVAAMCKLDELVWHLVLCLMTEKKMILEAERHEAEEADRRDYEEDMILKHELDEWLERRDAHGSESRSEAGSDDTEGEHFSGADQDYPVIW